MSTNDNTADGDRSFGLRVGQRIGNVGGKDIGSSGNGSFVLGNLVLVENWRAGDLVCAVFLRRLEGDVVAETRSLDDHKICAGRDLFDSRYTIGSGWVAMELDLYTSLLARQVAEGTAGDTLYEISALSASLELADGLLVRELLLTIMGRLFLDSAKHETGNSGIFDWRVGRDALRGRQLVELLDALTVAISVAPPATPVVDAVALHAFQQLPAPGVCASQLFLMVLLGKRLIGLCRGFLIDDAWYLAQVMLVCENELLIVVLWLVGFERICVRVGAGRVVRVNFLLSLQVRNMAFWEVDRELRCNQSVCLDEGGVGGCVPEGKQEHRPAR